MADHSLRLKWYWSKVALDGVLLAASFLAVYRLRRGHIDIEPQFLAFLPALFLTWFIVTVFSRKFHRVEGGDYFKKIGPLWRSAVIQTLLLTLVLYVAGWFFLSRLIVYGSLALFAVLEISIVTIRIYIFPAGARSHRFTFGVFLFLAESAFIASAFLVIYFTKKDSFRLRENYALALLGICIVWLIVSLSVHRFRVNEKSGYLRFIQPYWKTEILITLLVALVIVAGKFAELSRGVVLGSLLAFAVFENFILAIRYFVGRPKDGPASVGISFRAEAADVPEKEPFESLWDPMAAKYHLDAEAKSTDMLRRKLKKIYLSKFDNLFEFIDANIDLEKFSLMEAVFLYSPHLYNIEILDDDSISFLLNLEDINNIRVINQVLIEINKKLKQGGVFIGQYQSLEQRKDTLFEKYPWIFAKIAYVIDFVWARICPKLPLVKKLYFAVSKGYNRALSNTECGGRLYYCGFEIQALRKIDHHYFFIARKIKEPSTDANPSYGLFFRQRRVGQGGRIIRVLKMRTMHPFAEYLHHRLLEMKALEASGKVEDDFRITSWGRAFRKVYLDEMPMLWNWLKRDLKLVGVRPLSETFLATYPEDLKLTRQKVKPGVFPPFYADLPDGIEEVWESERKYLEKYAKRPVRTDIRYLIKGLKNIFFNHARSK